MDLLPLMVLVPLLGAVLVALLPLTGVALKRFGLGFALISLALPVWAVFSRGGVYGYSHSVSVEWIGALGIWFNLGMDGVSAMMVLLTAVLVPVVVLAEWRRMDGGSPRAFLAWVLALEALSFLVFTATDLFLFYVVFEATLIPAYFLVAGSARLRSAEGAEPKDRRRAAAVKFLVFQLAGGLVMLLSVIGLFVVARDAGASMQFDELAALDLDDTTQRWLFVGFFIAFAAKAPLFPLHTWLADTTEQSTPGTSILLVCVLDKIGTYGMLKICLGMLPGASEWATPVVLALALVSVVWGALLAIGSDDILRLVGLTSLSHFGLITVGLFAGSHEGASAATFYMLNHGLATAALFLVAGYLVERTGTSSISQMGGLQKAAPVLAGVFVVAGMAVVGLPGLSTFVSEIAVIAAAFGHSWWVGAVAVSSIVLAAVYVLAAYRRTMTGPEQARFAHVGDLRVREVVAVAPLLVALVVLGFAPQLALGGIDPAVSDALLGQFSQAGSALSTEVPR